MAQDFINLLADLKEEEVIALTKKRLAAKEDALKIMEDARKGMEIVGKRFAGGEYFLPELVFSGELLTQVTNIVKPYLTGSGAKVKKLGKVVIGTVAGDIHDIGLNIVEFMLDVNGYEVTSLGVDVPVQKFVDAMKETVEALEKAGLRKNMKIMIGGGQMDDEVRKYAKADAFGKDAMAAVTLTNGWYGIK